MPAACAISATFGMSRTSRPGLPMVSATTSRVRSPIAARKPARSRGLTNVVRMPKRGSRMRQEIDRAAIERSGRNDMVAGTQQRSDGEMHRRHAACGANRADAIFQRRQAFLQHGRRRIGNACVDVAGALQVEQACGVIGIVEHIRGGLIDRHGTRACNRVGMLPGVQAQSLEGGRFRSGHTSSRRDGVKPDMSHRIRRLPMQQAPVRRLRPVAVRLSPSAGRCAICVRAGKPTAARHSPSDGGADRRSCR